jgi:hypothetical protein
MGDPLYHFGAVAQCPHTFGQITVQSASQRVKVSGQAVATMGDKFNIAGCPFTVPTNKPQPCDKALFTQPALRVKSGGKAVILKTSLGICQSVEQIPQGPPKITATQTRVKGT